MSEIKNVGFNTKFIHQENLHEDIENLIDKYAGSLSVAQFIGVLEIIKHEMLINNMGG